MANDDAMSWDNLLQTLLREIAEARGSRVSVERDELQDIEHELSKLVLATERRFQETDSLVIVEHRERLRRELVSMNTLRLRVRALARSAT